MLIGSMNLKQESRWDGDSDLFSQIVEYIVFQWHLLVHSTYNPANLSLRNLKNTGNKDWVPLMLLRSVAQPV